MKNQSYRPTTTMKISKSYYSSIFCPTVIVTIALLLLLLPNRSFAQQEQPSAPTPQPTYAGEPCHVCGGDATLEVNPKLSVDLFTGSAACTDLQEAGRRRLIAPGGPCASVQELVVDGCDCFDPNVPVAVPVGAPIAVPVAVPPPAPTEPDLAPTASPFFVAAETEPPLQVPAPTGPPVLGFIPVSPVAPPEKAPTIIPAPAVPTSSGAPVSGTSSPTFLLVFSTVSPSPVPPSPAPTYSGDPCYVCGGYANATVNPSQTVTFAFNTFGCNELEEWGRRRLASPVECNLLVPLVLERCQCQAVDGTNITLSTTATTAAPSLAPTVLKTFNPTAAERTDGGGTGGALYALSLLALIPVAAAALIWYRRRTHNADRVAMKQTPGHHHHDNADETSVAGGGDADQQDLPTHTITEPPRPPPPHPPSPNSDGASPARPQSRPRPPPPQQQLLQSRPPAGALPRNKDQARSVAAPEPGASNKNNAGAVAEASAQIISAEEGGEDVVAPDVAVAQAITCLPDNKDQCRDVRGGHSALLVADAILIEDEEDENGAATTEGNDNSDNKPGPNDR